MEQERQTQGRKDGERSRTHYEHHGVPECLPEQRVACEPGIVVNPDEAQIREVPEGIDIEVGKAEQETPCERKEEEHQDDEKRRGDEPIASTAALRGHAAHQFGSPLGGKVERHDAGGNRFASRTNTHEPFVCLRKMDNALPDRTFASPPESGVMPTV